MYGFPGRKFAAGQSAEKKGRPFETALKKAESRKSYFPTFTSRVMEPVAPVVRADT